MKRFRTIVILLLLCTATAVAQDRISVESTVDKQSITIGDRIKYTVKITADTSLIVDSLTVGTNLGMFEVKDYTPRAIDIKDGMKISTESFEITTFTTGDYQIPPITIKYSTATGELNSVVTDAIAIKVNSLLTGEEGEDIKPLRGPKDFASKIPIWMIAAAAALIVAIAVFWYLYRRARRPIDLGKEPIDERLPWEIALEELNALKASDLVAKGEYKEYYLRLSEIFRRYLERRYGIQALERTTYEIIIEFRSLALENSEEEVIYHFLDECDMVKFAKHDPTQEDITRHFETAREFVMQTRSLPFSSAKGAAQG
ncbi:MAG: BatD family protein [Candidatus Zixiibacteriota bacterium]